MRLIGLDLAWSIRNPSGGAVLDGDQNAARLVDTALLTTDDSILEFVDRHAERGPAIVAVDAPLIVPNTTGRRPAEAELSPVYGRYQAGAHSANRVRVGDASGSVRGERLVEALEARGFTHDPQIPAGEPVRRVVEVYPHPAMIALFDLPMTLKYKAKSGRSAAVLHAAWETYHRELRALETADPALTGLGALLAADVSLLRGKALKGHEDRVDAVMCAYLALYAHRWGMARNEVFGSMTGGYILTPKLPGR